MHDQRFINFLCDLYFVEKYLNYLNLWALIFLAVKLMLNNVFWYHSKSVLSIRLNEAYWDLSYLAQWHITDISFSRPL